MRDSLKRFKLGLGVLGAIALGLTIFVLAQAGNAKADLKTHKAAVKIADQLNTYIAQEQTIPQSLKAAGIDDNSSVSYRRIGDDKYRFCVTYKASSSAVDTSRVVQDAMMGYSTRMLGGVDSLPSVLSLSIGHEKGENCQTVRPYITDYGTQKPKFNFDDFRNDFQDMEDEPLESSDGMQTQYDFSEL